MNDNQPVPPAMPPQQPSLLRRLAPYLLYIVSVVAAALLGSQVGPPPPPPPPPLVLPLALSGADGGYTPTFGWIQDPEAIRANLDPLKTVQFDVTPAGRKFMAPGDTEMFLWRATRQAAGRNPTDTWYPNINQGSVGCCVGAGNKHAADISQAVQIVLLGKPGEWKPLSAEVIYGGSREVGGMLGGGDGSTGSAAANWQRQYGEVPMEKVGSVDLSVFSPQRARQYGASGISAELKEVAKQHPVQSTALVKTAGDVKAAVLQGYPVAVCSNQGFTMTRDQDGFARPQGSWPHCMCICGYRSAPREGFFILNSWGDSAHTGPVYPADMPVAGFWADSRTVGRMVAEGDSFALSNMVGFPARNVDWFVLVSAIRPALSFARLTGTADRRADFSLSP